MRVPSLPGVSASIGSPGAAVLAGAEGLPQRSAWADEAAPLAVVIAVATAMERPDVGDETDVLPLLPSPPGGLAAAVITSVS
ncbi:hypothetical protein [Paraburkholderia sp. BL10I2N1]|uniref:hypothetical protein n=1 Tax=Paraburkholderia sp. BL10I2N1 TaxID=1938796 RepID=UPI001FB62029|nr:hypothetical protein [Paraburkholderia sp. BL10I2N1]